MAAAKVMVPAGPLVAPMLVRAGGVALFQTTLVEPFHQSAVARSQEPLPSCPPALLELASQVTNAGTTGDSFLLTAPKLAAGWKTQYVDWSTGKDITASVTGSGWKTVVVKPGASLGYTLHLTPDGTVPALPASLPITAVSTLDGAKKDTVKATTTVSPRYQPDLAICNYGETGYLGLGVCNTGGANQTKNQTIPAGKMVTYLFEVKNAGNTADTFTVHCALPAASGWKVQWVDRASGKDITGAVIANGSLTAPIPAGVAALYTLHVTPSAAATTTPYPLLITATSSRDQTKSDAVKAVTTKQ